MHTVSAQAVLLLTVSRLTSSVSFGLLALEFSFFSLLECVAFEAVLLCRKVQP